MAAVTLLDQRLRQGDTIILDGAMGTELERRGVPMHGDAWSAVALQTHRNEVRQAHEDYIRAGADVIITNTFASAGFVLEQAGMGDLANELNARAVTLARQARDNAADRVVYIAGSISFNTRPTGNPADHLREMEPSYRAQAQVLAEAGVDILVLEMMRHVEQAKLAIDVAKSTGLPVWLGLSCKRSDAGGLELLRGEGETFSQALEEVLSSKVDVVSVMHTDVDITLPALQVLREHWSGPMGAYPNSGWFTMPNWHFEDVIAPEAFLSQARRWVQAGAQVIGGCCGIGPEHIALLKGGLPGTARRQ